MTRRSQTVRPEDALEFLRLALAAPPKSKLRQTYLDAALLEYYFGMLNRHHFDAKSDRRGGNRKPYDDAWALARMAEIASVTGETRPGALARMLVNGGGVALNGAQQESVIARLAASYRRSK